MKKALQTAAPRMERAAWLTLGFLALGLGGLGAILPLLPTTPFIILAAFAFGRSAPGLQSWLEESRAFGQAIRDWRANGAIGFRFKLLAIALMAAVFALSVVLSAPPAVLVTQIVCLSGAAAFILSRPDAIRSAPARMVPRTGRNDGQDTCTAAPISPYDQGEL